MKKLLYLFLTVLIVACSGDINSDVVESGETETNPSKPNTKSYGQLERGGAKQKSNRLYR